MRGTCFLPKEGGQAHTFYVRHESFFKSQEFLLDKYLPHEYNSQGMEKIVEQGLLYDFYGQLLTAHQQKIYEQAVYENLSYNEIAEQEGISRQAVHDLIRRTTSLMQRYESRLGMIRRFRSLREAADDLTEAADTARTREELADCARVIADRIRKDLT